MRAVELLLTPYHRSKHAEPSHQQRRTVGTEFPEPHPVDPVDLDDPPAAVGEVNVVTQMKAVNAVIGGEGNGGIIYPTSHNGRDALVGIGLFLTHLAKFGKSISKLRASYPNYHISKNKIELTPQIDVDKILLEIKTKYQKHPINDIDGVKIEFGKEWVHLRKSNTEPIIRIYSESDSEATAEHLAKKLIQDIKEVVSASLI